MRELVQLGIIRSKADAKEFARKCENGHWGHVFGLDQNIQTQKEAWKYRKHINDTLRETRKYYDSV